MKKVVLFLLSFAVPFLYGNYDDWSQELGALPKIHEVYQDIFVDGKVIYKGIRDCESRWNTLDNFFKRLPEHSFKMLDIGASEGYFTFKTAFLYPNSEYQMVEAGKVTAYRLKKYLEWNGNPSNINLLAAAFDANFSMERLKYQHYDIVLCFNVIHHICARRGNNVTEVLKKLKSIGTHILIETPDDVSRGILEVVSKEPGAELLGTYSRHTSTHGKGYLFYLPGDLR